MIELADDEIITDRDLYLYHCGMMHEYLRNREHVDKEDRIMLHEWIKSDPTHTIHNNPWNIRKRRDRGYSYDYLDALEIHRATSK